ncbi:hypothetical protein IT411_01145, partial [Candidatus Peregrinibacteria bacterium]|nr:hypothetical protein [Candidatus Peregrinibacteria bacterium]
KAWLGLVDEGEKLSLVRSIREAILSGYKRWLMIFLSRQDQDVMDWMKKNKQFFGEAFNKKFLGSLTSQVLTFLPRRKAEYKYFLDRMARKALGQILGNVDQDVMAALYLSQQIFSKREIIEEMPDEILISMSSAYEDFLEKKRKEFKEKLPTLIDSIKQKIYAAIDNGQIPVKKSKVKQVLKYTVIDLADPVVMKLEKIRGLYEADRRSILLDATLDPKDMEKVLMHEIMHALSGQTNLLITGKEYGIEYEDLNHLRVGLGFTSKSGFRWLNEAMTEALTIATLKLPDSNSYSEERKLLEILMKHINPELLKKAYFEEYNPKIAAEQRLPAWRALTQAIDQKFGPKFLIRLNKFIQDYDSSRMEDEPTGLEQAAGAFEDFGEQFPKFLEEYLAKKYLTVPSKSTPNEEESF